MYIYLIRHGQTEWNVQKRIQGREDIPLSPEGLAQAEVCGGAFSGRKLSAVLASPLSRAVQTADAIAKVSGLSVIADGRFIERDFASISGRVLDDIYAIEQYTDIEPVAETASRMLSAINEYANTLDGDFAVVSHGGSINSLLSILSHGEAGSGKTRLKNVCVSIIKYENGEFSLLDFNLEPWEFAEKYPV